MDNSPQMLPPGYLNTRGSQIVDQNGSPVRIASVGWFDLRNIPSAVNKIKTAGFNCIRVQWVNARMNRELPLIDQVVSSATQSGIKIILDNHACEGGGDCDSQQKNGLWYDVGGVSDGTDGCGHPGTVSDSKFLDDWLTVARRYATNTTVIGYDLRNEPLSYGGMCTWGDGNINTDLRLMYQRVGNAVLAIDPGKLIICEGPQNYNSLFSGTGKSPWGDLSLVEKKPVILNIPNKVVYSIHDYPIEIAQFSPDNGPQKVQLMNTCWGYLVTKNIAPVWVGEMGSNMKSPTDAAWAKTLTDYMNGKLGSQGGPVFTGADQGISGDWWAWGNLDGQQLIGTLDSNGNLRPEQQAVWSEILFRKTSPDNSSAKEMLPTIDKLKLLLQESQNKLVSIRDRISNFQ